MPRNTGNNRRTVALLALTLLASLALASPSAAAVRYASPSSADTTGACASSATACRLDHAVGAAAVADEVVVLPGDYTINYQVRATAAVNVHGADGQPRPRLLGAAGNANPTLELAAGGTASHLYVETSAQTALKLAGGARGDRLKLVAKNVAAGAEAARLLGSVVPTKLTNTLALSEAAGNGAGVSIVDDALGGSATLVNVTAIASDSDGWAVVSDLPLTSPVLVNVLARGGVQDVYGRAGSRPVSLSSSAFRPTQSENYSNGALNYHGEVTFADGDFRVVQSDPTVNAGVPDALVNGGLDLDGRERLLGLAPDIGAYEFEIPASGGGGSGQGGGGGGGSGDGGGAGDGLPVPITELPALVPPVLGQSVGAQAAAGTVLVQLPGSSTPVPLTAGASLPVGTIVDATNGRVTLTSVRDASGKVQSGEFWGGAFQIRQRRGRRPYTELVLVGGDFSVCRGARASGLATAARGRHSARVRRLWGRDRKGRFRTKGRSSHATVRGTVWLVEDRCDGTRTTVREGAVMVRDLKRRRNVLVKAGRSYLARSR